MKTTLELPDELMREVKIRAVNENRRIKDVVADALRRGLAQEGPAPARVRQRVQLPLVECVHEAHPDDEMTPDRVATILLSEEAEAFSGPDR